MGVSSVGPPAGVWSSAPANDKPRAVQCAGDYVAAAQASVTAVSIREPRFLLLLCFTGLSVLRDKPVGELPDLLYTWSSSWGWSRGRKLGDPFSRGDPEKEPEDKSAALAGSACNP